MRVLILCGLIAALAAPAQAGGVRPAKGVPDAYQVTVDYADLDLDRGAGADMLIGRIRQAARAVCGESVHPRDLAGRSRARQSCISLSMDTAIGQVGSPLVTARYERSRSAAMLAAR